MGPDAGKRRQAAYLSAVTVWLTASASEMHLAPSAPMPLTVKLQKGVERRRQRVLTVGERPCGSVLDARKRFVDLEGLRELLNARRIRLKFILIVIVAAKRVSLQAAVRVEGHQ